MKCRDNNSISNCNCSSSDTGSGEFITASVVPEVILKSSRFADEAAGLAERLGSELHDFSGLSEDEISKAQIDSALALIYDDDGLTLCGSRAGNELELRGDFGSMKRRVLRGKLAHETLVKAAKIKNLDHQGVAIDATAGLGEDSMLLAAAGYQVYMYENNPVIAALLADALRRALEDSELMEIAGRMTLVEGDSLEALGNLDFRPDLVFLDPMFPARQKSALVKKKFQLLQQLEMPCSEEDEMIKAAMAAGPRRIVIKRPAKGPFLGGVKPSYQIDGKAIRYDCIVL